MALHGSQLKPNILWPIGPCPPWLLPASPSYWDSSFSGTPVLYWACWNSLRFPAMLWYAWPSNLSSSCFLWPLKICLFPGLQWNRTFWGKCPYMPTFDVPSWVFFISSWSPEIIQLILRCNSRADVFLCTWSRKNKKTNMWTCKSLGILRLNQNS